MFYYAKRSQGELQQQPQDPTPKPSKERNWANKQKYPRLDQQRTPFNPTAESVEKHQRCDPMVQRNPGKIQVQICYL